MAFKKNAPRYYGAYSLRPTRDAGPTSRALDAYFAGDLAALDGIPVRMPGTEFQTSVWTALRRIPVGTTVSYSGLAQQVGRQAGCRAVGFANGANPVGIVVPCHRVIGADGGLTGYGGGIERKRWLLEHEGAKLKASGGYMGDLFPPTTADCGDRLRDANRLSTQPPSILTKL